jgi:hypothetical protein
MKEKEMRDAIEFFERLTLFKTNGYRNLSSIIEPIARKPREHFVDYCVRVRAAYPVDHKLPRQRLRRRAR